MIKTEQLQHQAEFHERFKDVVPGFCLFWEMGLGKSKAILDVAAHLWTEGQIKALLIVAPNSVYGNWINHEIPKHLGVDHWAIAYPKKTSAKDWAMRQVYLDKELRQGQLRVVSMSYDSLRTEHGEEFASMLAVEYDTMMVLDESTAISSPSSKVTKICKKIGPLCRRRAIATGTPAADSPFEIHSQIEFVDPNFWGRHQLRTITAFKSYFGQYVSRDVGRKTVPQVVGYRFLDQMQKIIEPISSRLLKEDSCVKLPPKMYSVREFEMTDDQWRVYHRVKTEFYAELDAGLQVTAPLAIVRMARFQQITSGFVTAGPLVTDRHDDEGFPDAELATKFTVTDLVAPENNPRLILLGDIVDECRHKVIVWCKFRRDVDNICGLLGDRCVRYDGTTTGRDRETALRRFCDVGDQARVFVANSAAISMGVTLVVAKTMVYYSNNFSLKKRLQSEDRAHRIGQDSNVHIVDLIAERTVDVRIQKSLREKFSMAAQVTGDRLREWI